MAETLRSERSRIWLWLIVFGGALVRLVGLTRESFWNDEAFSGWVAQLPTLSDVWAAAQTDVHPPGHLLMGWFWGHLFGVSDFTLRLTSALAGIGLILVAYRLGRQLYDVRTGLVTALLVAFMTKSVYYSQEFRAYMFVALTTAICGSLAIDIDRNQGDHRNKWRLALLALTMIAGSYFHYFGLLLSLLIAGALVLRVRKTQHVFWGAIGAGLCLLLAYIPWIPTVLESAGRRSYPVRPTLKDVALVSNVFYGPGIWLNILAATVLAIGISLLYFRAPRTLKLKKDVWLALWILAPLAVSITISLIRVPVFTPRNMFIVVTPAFLLLARALVGLSKDKWAFIVTFAFLTAHHVLQATHEGYFFRPTKQQIREASNYALTRIGPGEKIRVVDWDELNVGYYARQAHRSELIEVFHADPNSDFTAPWQGTFWYVYAGVAPQKQELLTKRFEILDDKAFIEARAMQLRRKTDSP